MSYNKKSGFGIAKYFKRMEEGAKGGPTKDPSRITQLSRMEGTGQGEAGPTHTNTHTHTNTDINTNTKDEDGGGNNTDNKGYVTADNDKKDEEGNANAYAYGGMKEDRKGKRDAHLGPQKIKSPQNAAPSDDEVTWGMFPPPGSKGEAKLDQGGGAASKHVPEEDGAVSMGASWRAAEV